MSKHIVIGCGETGAPLATLLEESKLPIERHDPAIGFKAKSSDVSIVHICIPWSKDFLGIMQEYKTTWNKPDIIWAIHSTVPIGTTQKLRNEMRLRSIHTPIRGMHMTMLQDLKIYVKFIGYDDAADADRLERECLHPAGIKTRRLFDSRSTELGKLLELCRYGLNISFAREQDKICRSLNLSYQNVVSEFVKTHNDGMSQRSAPYLYQQEVCVPKGPIGGHCVLSGMKIITEQFEPFILSHVYAQERSVEGCPCEGIYSHPSAIISPDAEIGRGTKVWHFSHIREGATIGEDCSIGQGCYVAESAKIGSRVRIGNGVDIFNGVVIEDDCFIAPRVIFTNDLYPPSGIITKTLVRKGAAIGAGTTIVCGVTIGSYAKIGAGSVVIHDIPDGATYAGVPAYPLSSEIGRRWGNAQRNYAEIS